MSYTKQKWEYREPNHIFVGEHVLTSVNGFNFGEMKANARLIAKAPEMYELLTLLVRDDLLAIGIAMEISKLLGEIEGKS